jgi:hypothetical protein
MIQKKKNETLGVYGGIKFKRTSPLRPCCKLQQKFPSQLDKNHVYLSTNKIVGRIFGTKFF